MVWCHRDDLADLRSASVVPDVLNSIDQSAGVQLNVTYASIGNQPAVTFHTSTGRLTLAQTADRPYIHVRKRSATLQLPPAAFTPLELRTWAQSQPAEMHMEQLGM